MRSLCAGELDFNTRLASVEIKLSQIQVERDNVVATNQQLELTVSDLERTVTELLAKPAAKDDVKRNETQLIDEKELTNKKEIGAGSFKVVYRALWLGTPVAVLSVRLLPSMNKALVDSHVGAFHDELAHLQSLRHPNIVSYQGQVSRGANGLELACVTELCVGGSLHDALYGTDEWLPTVTQRNVGLKWHLARDLVCALVYLHSRRPPVLHLDLKPANCLLTASCELKVADFGLSVLQLRSSGLSAGKGGVGMLVFFLLLGFDVGLIFVVVVLSCLRCWFGLISDGLMSDGFDVVVMVLLQARFITWQKNNSIFVRERNITKSATKPMFILWLVC